MNKNSNLPPETKVAIFKGKEIRKIIYNNEWWFSIADVISVLTDSTDVRQYIKKMRQRDPQLKSYWGTICTPLELLAPDGKKRETNCANTEGIFRIIQSVASPKAEPFKHRLGYRWWGIRAGRTSHEKRMGNGHSGRLYKNKDPVFLQAVARGAEERKRQSA